MSTTEQTTKERVLALHDKLGQMWDEEGVPAVFRGAGAAAHRLGVDRRQMTLVVWLLARARGNDNAAAAAISSYAAREALPQHEHETIGGEERCAFIAVNIAFDLEGAFGSNTCLHCADELTLDHLGTISYFLGPAPKFGPDDRRNDLESEEDPDDI
jgi:hypothetical protein